VFPTVFEFAAKSQELLLATSLSVCFMFALLFNEAGLSIAVGAFVAGILLANLPYNIEIVGKMKPLRDFFVILFFTSLGLQLQLNSIKAIIIPLVLLSALVIFIKPLSVIVTLLLSKHTSRTSFMTGASIAQISEFSLIVIAQGVAMGVVSTKLLTLTIMLAIVTMTFTSYFMGFETKFYHLFRKTIDYLHLNVKHDNPLIASVEYDSILCGCDRIGFSILDSLVKNKRNVMVVDFNPDVIKKISSFGIPCMYGDISDHEVVERLNLSKAKFVVSTANVFEDNHLLLKRTKKSGSSSIVIMTAHTIDEALALYREGADYVILPHFLGGDVVASMITNIGRNRLEAESIRNGHITELIARRNFSQIRGIA
jgi:voltage-gated potassium channel Kch